MSVAAEKILSHPSIPYLKLILTTCLMCGGRKRTDKACFSSRATCMAFGRLAILTVGLISFPGMMVVSRHATRNFGRYNMPDPENREGAQVCCRSHMEIIQADLLDSSEKVNDVMRVPDQECFGTQWRGKPTFHYSTMEKRGSTRDSEAKYATRLYL
jgi:hypothetical protein